MDEPQTPNGDATRTFEPPLPDASGTPTRAIGDRPPEPSLGSTRIAPTCARKDPDLTRTYLSIARTAAVEGLEDETATDTVRSRIATINVTGFEIIRWLGEGGMGVVFLAQQVLPSRSVALKRLWPHLAAQAVHLKRFLEEPQAMARVASAHVLPVHEVKLTEDGPVLVMPFIDGPDLRRVILHRQAQRKRDAAAGRLKTGDDEYLRVVLPLLDQVVEAIVAVHRNDVIHRDIKPSNVLIDSSGGAWLNDFGLAKTFDGGAEPSITMGSLGTPGYMGPEQWEGLDVGRHSDVFGLGATLYYTLCLDLPHGRGPLSRAAPDPTRPSTLQPLLDADWDAVLMKAVAPDPADRYRTVDELHDDWRSLREGRRPKAGKYWSRRRLGKRLRRNARLLAAAAAVTALIPIGVLADRLMRPPADPNLRTVRITSNRPTYEYELVARDPITRLLDPSRVVHGTSSDGIARVDGLRPGPYRLVLAAGDNFVEVERDIPAPGEKPSSYGPAGKWAEAPDGLVDIPQVNVYPRPSTDDMIRVPGAKGFTYYLEPGRRVGMPRDIDPFRVAARQFTYGDARAMRRKYSSSTFRVEPRRRDDEIVTDLTYDDAMELLELLGCRMLEDWEWYYLATNRGTTDFPGDGVVPEDWKGRWAVDADVPGDVSIDPPGVVGLYSGPGEWTATTRNGLGALFRLSGMIDSRRPFDGIIRGLVGTDRTQFGDYDEAKRDWARFVHQSRVGQAAWNVGMRPAVSERPPFLRPSADPKSGIRSIR